MCQSHSSYIHQWLTTKAQLYIHICDGVIWRRSTDEDVFYSFKTVLGCTCLLVSYDYTYSYWNSTSVLWCSLLWELRLYTVARASAAASLARDWWWGAHAASWVDWLAALAARPRSCLALIGSWLPGLGLNVFASVDHEDRLAIKISSRSKLWCRLTTYWWTRQGAAVNLPSDFKN